MLRETISQLEMKYIKLNLKFFFLKIFILVSKKLIEKNMHLMIQMNH